LFGHYGFAQFGWMLIIYLLAKLVQNPFLPYPLNRVFFSFREKKYEGAFGLRNKANRARDKKIEGFLALTGFLNVEEFLFPFLYLKKINGKGGMKRQATELDAGMVCPVIHLRPPFVLQSFSIP
jgi:hypothetical protein